MKFIKVFRTDRSVCEYFSINLIEQVHIWKGEVKAHGEILFSNGRHFWFKVSDCGENPGIGCPRLANCDRRYRNTYEDDG